MEQLSDQSDDRVEKKPVTNQTADFDKMFITK